LLLCLHRISGIGVSGRDEIVEVVGALRASPKRLHELTFDVLSTPERLLALEGPERMARELRAPQHALISYPLADRLRITKAEAGRRVAKAADLGGRRALTGEPLEPRLPATAAAQRLGEIGDGHVKIIRGFFPTCPPRWTTAPGSPPTPAWPICPRVSDR
jgi:hypothetical protein